VGLAVRLQGRPDAFQTVFKVRDLSPEHLRREFTHRNLSAMSCRRLATGTARRSAGTSRASLSQSSVSQRESPDRIQGQPKNISYLWSLR
jgi:hypothetical protein